MALSPQAQSAVEKMHVSSDRLDRFLDRQDRAAAIADAVADAVAQEERRREDEARRDRSRRHADACTRHQARYDRAFQAFGQRSPQAAADAFPGDYRRDLFKKLQDRLPNGHMLASDGGLDPEDLDSETLSEFEKRLIEAAIAEGISPSGSNRADSVYDPGAVRDRIDPATGQRFVEFFAKRSFIADMSRPAVRVKIRNPLDFREMRLGDRMMTQSPPA
jgi:hypothetical protein